MLLVGCYVDDLVITGNCPSLIKSFKADLAKRFKITDMGDGMPGGSGGAMDTTDARRREG